MSDGDTKRVLPDGIPTEEAVVRFLREDPGFLRRHPELLEVLEVAQGVRGAVSLLEFQARRLRERNDRLRAQQARLIEAARRNEDLGNRLHELALALMEAEDAEDVVAVAREHLRAQCAIAAMNLRLWCRGDPGRGLSFTLPEAQVQHGLAELLRERRVLFVDPAHDAVRALLGEASVRSAVLVPMADGHWKGVLALGSEDPSRFRDGMGTLFVSQLGALLGRALRTRLEPPGRDPQRASDARS